MGNRYTVQGPCKVCGTYTHSYCSHCGSYVCEEHRYIKEIQHGQKEIALCKKCYEKGKKVIDSFDKKI
ncbi:MAG: hypothetical protein ACQESF_02105 [Nanobdellota archaeon]